jgi:hypothetical protein
MPPRYIIRPKSIRKTPTLLKTALGALRTVRYPSSFPQSYAWGTDFFLVYPHPSKVLGADDAYRKIYEFSSSDKRVQRSILHELGFNTPHNPDRDGSEVGIQYIVRPLRHSGGRGYRLTENREDYDEGTEYIQEVFRKDFEYRIISSFGVPIITLRKTNRAEIPPELPWNHDNGTFFQTISDPFQTCRLRHTNIYDVIRSSDLLRSIHLAGIDVMFKQPNEYAVCEVNLCPAMTIEENLRKVADHVRSYF